MASRTASAPCPASAGPFLVRGPSPWPAMRGRWSSIVNRVVRSTSVPMAKLPNPTMRSPSQWPGTARSAASAGRWLIRISGAMQGDAGLAPSAGARPRHPQRPPGAQAGGQLAAQRSPALHVKRLVDGFVTDAHGLIIGEVEPQAAGDLFRAPRRGPPPVLPTPVPAALPGPDRPPEPRPARGDDQPGEPVLHVAPQRLVDRQLGRLRTAGGAVGVPLRGRGPVRQSAAARGGVAAQLARDRGRRALQLAGDLPHPVPLRAPDRDLLPLGKRQITP